MCAYFYMNIFCCLIDQNVLGKLYASLKNALLTPLVPCFGSMPALFNSAVSKQVNATKVPILSGANDSILNDAFAATNKGAHQGVFTISVRPDVTETAAYVLNSSGARAANYSSILIIQV